ncbi:MAG: histidinol-phosphatase [Hyphomicrobiales bacterium]|nr:histidinol-phosphatase [Hyphomicrobiales bacterium]
MSGDISEFIEFAHGLADSAGAEILPMFRNFGEVENKDQDGFDPVTAADRAAERVMRVEIEARYPDHGIFGEEFPRRRAAGAYEWVLDPIDGTRAFICGLPLWGTLIGLSENGKPLIGVMDQPYLGERFWGGPDGAFFRNRQGEKEISTRKSATLDTAILGATTPEMFEGEDADRFYALGKNCRMTRYGADCYMYCMLASGLVDIVAEARLKPFDIAPLIPIIEAAGGCVTTWDGADAGNGGNVLASCSPALHESALRTLNM